MQIKKKIDSDVWNIAILMFLYILQGIPLGLAGSIPMILQQRNVSYKDQASFSLSFWPFSIKILWAPIVDSCYWLWMGRRKSWLIPSQYLIGITMLLMSNYVDFMLGYDDGKPHVLILTAAFFFMNTMAATQDIAVDGWALTMLSRKNVGWASTCNSVGQTAGYFLGYVVFLALESRDFCVNYLGFQDKLVTLSGFFYFWGIIFLLTTTAVWIFKTEELETEIHNEEIELSLVGSYKVLYKLLCKSTIFTFISILLTVKIGFAAADSLTVLKLTESGIPKEKLAMLSIPLTPVQIFLPLFISKYTSGSRPLDVYLKAFVPRLFLGLLFALVVYYVPYFKDPLDGQVGYSFYILLITVYLIHQVASNCMFVSIMAFHAKISDTKIGGTYMTLLNTFSNLGSNWPAWVALRYVSELTWKTCVADGHSEMPCDSPEQLETCLSVEGSCNIKYDGYYLESILFFFVGLLWYKIGGPIMRKLQNVPKEKWDIRL